MDSEASRGFGFLRFPSIEKSRAFLERNYPIIQLYGKGSTDGDDQAAKVRVAFSRERDDRGRADKAEGEWACKIVRHCFPSDRQIANNYSAHLSIFPVARSALNVSHLKSVCPSF